MLRALIPSPGTPTTTRTPDVARCSFCGVPTGGWSCDEACAICHITLNLGRPRIDEEALLCWLPEISQATVSRVVREMHLRCTGSTARTPTIAAARYVGLALTERVDRATEILGTKSPSELAKALTLLSPAAYATRHRLLGGIRVLPSGHLFEGDRNIFPELVARWSSRQPSPGGAE